jgi:threonine synthase
MSDQGVPTGILSDEARPSAASSSPEAFASAIDRRHEASRSVVLRYRNAVRLEPDDEQDTRLKALFERTSIAEGLRVFPLFTHRDVEIDVLDETSLMGTRTLKSIDGCVTTAQCLLRGHRRVVFESGGNTGTALTVYGTRAGLDTFFFVPAENLPLLDGKAFASATAHVIAVDDPREVKPAAAAFAARHGLARVPVLDWRLQASTFVGCFVLEHLLACEPYDVLAQSISGAFSPVGIYRMIGKYREKIGRLPAFLGVQQAANCPMVRAWKAGTDAAAVEPVESTAELLAKVMYDGNPGTYGTFGPLRRILVETGGDLTTIDREDFRWGLWADVGGKTVLDHLAEHGVLITLREGEVLEKAGLMALAGTLREIESGRIAPGSRVLVCVTGGTARPEGIVAATRWADEEMEDRRD